jgi:hypothetical protein
MTEFWQNLAIVSAVGGAVAYLAIRLIGWRRRRRACSECRLRELVAGGGERQRNNPPAN